MTRKLLIIDKKELEQRILIIGNDHNISADSKERGGGDHPKIVAQKCCHVSNSSLNWFFLQNYCLISQIEHFIQPVRISR